MIEAIKTETEKVIEKTDGLMSCPLTVLIMENSDLTNAEVLEDASVECSKTSIADEDSGIATVDNLDDSEDDSDYDTSESEEEFMPDGERVRKTSRGFKQISNCKRFWKASLLTG